jgi:hypothetical protein
MISVLASLVEERCRADGRDCGEHDWYCDGSCKGHVARAALAWPLSDLLSSQLLIYSVGFVLNQTSSPKLRMAWHVSALL